MKNEGRIEALFFVYFLALLVQAVIERELRVAMHRQRIESLPLYPEDRESHRPTAEQILRLFAHVEGHIVTRGSSAPTISQPPLSERQRQVLQLLGVPKGRYTMTR